MCLGSRVINVGLPADEARDALAALGAERQAERQAAGGIP